MTFKSGDTKAATLLVANVLTKDYQFSQAKAAEKAADIIKKVKAENQNFDGKFLTDFIEKEMSKSTKAKPEVKKESLTAAQIKVSEDKKMSINEKIRQMILLTPKGHRVLKSLIHKAIGCSFQRVTNVQKSMATKTVTEEPKKPEPVTKTVTRRKASVPTRDTKPRQRRTKAA